MKWSTSAQNYNIHCCEDSIESISLKRKADSISSDDKAHCKKIISENEKELKIIAQSLIPEDKATKIKSMDNNTETSECEYEQITETNLICTSCHRSFNRKQCLNFVQEKYDMDNPVVKKVLSFRFIHNNLKEVICKSCSRYLTQKTPKLPPKAISSPGKVTVACTICNKTVDNKYATIFSSSNYNLDNITLKKLVMKQHQNINEHEGKYICNRCNTHLCRFSKVICNRCGEKYQRCKTLLYRKERYDALSRKAALSSDNTRQKELICRTCHYKLLNKVMCSVCKGEYSQKDTIHLKKSKYDLSIDHVNEALTSCGDTSGFICKKCDIILQQDVKCTCCHRQFMKRSCITLSIENYDFSDYIVSRALSSKNRLLSQHGEFICQKCHKYLDTSNGKHPTMPRHAHARQNFKGGQKFLKSIREKPEFVCTCCHRWLFQQTVQPFDSSKYNFNNNIVKRALADVNRYKMNVYVRKARRCPHLHPTDYDSESTDDSDDNINQDEDTNFNMWPSIRETSNQNDQLDQGMHKTFEYICVTCHRSLVSKKPKMPAQACANGLQISQIPPELQGLTRLERHLIGLRIPFMTIFCMQRFGSSYKVNGPTVDVPSTLDQIIYQLPRMSSEVQLYPMKLKRKLKYKGNYMYHFIRRDVVMGAIRWLKENNSLYKDIPINDNWEQEWNESEFSSFVDNINVLPCNNTNMDSIQEDTKNEEPASQYEELVPNTNVVNISDSVDNTSDSTTDSCCSKHDKNNSHQPLSVKVLDKYNEQDFRELAEDQAAADWQADVTGQVQSSVVQFEQIEEEVYSCAPGENNTPKYILTDDNFENLAFPDLFPTANGSYTFSNNRETRLPLRKYYQQRLLNVDGRFANNIEYLFCAQYATDIKQIQADTNLALQLTCGRTLGGKKVTAGMLKNPDVLKQLVKTEQAYKFLKNVRGSPAYWQRELYDVLAMLRMLGIPTWFLTLSAADLHWIEMIEAVSIHMGERLTRRQIHNMSIKDRSEKLKNNPVTACRMFQHRVEVFFRDYILDTTNPVGEVYDHVIKIEFQARGSPHAHCLLWVKDAPHIDIDSDNAVCAFIDAYISGRIPDDNPDNQNIQKMVKEFETHSHSAYCRRNGSCRFGFPKAPSPATVICREPDNETSKKQILNESSVILNRVHEILNYSDDNITMEELLQKANVTVDQYVTSIKVSRRGRNVVLQRNPCDVFTNGCNYKILQLWGGNVDFQFVLDEYSTIMYVCGYMMKSEKAMGEILKGVAKECHTEPIATQMKKLGKAFVGKRVVGAQESAMRILSMWLIKKSRKVIFVNASTKSDRVSLPKSKKIIDQMEADDEDIYTTSIHDRYAARPDDLENMCLARFAVTYDTLYGSQDNEKLLDDHNLVDLCDENEMNTQQDIITLKHHMGQMRCRKRESILRVKHFKEVTDSENYFHSRLLLYFPWRHEDNLLNGCKSYRNQYEKVHHLIEHNAVYFNKNSDKMDLAIENMEENGPPEIVWDAIAPAIDDNSAQGLHEDLVHIMQVDNELGEDYGDDISGGFIQAEVSTKKRNTLSMLYAKEARKGIMSAGEYRTYMRHLNPGQRKMVMFNRSWCKCAIKALRHGKRAHPYQVFLSGSAGTGKSHIIKLIRRDIIHMFEKTLVPQPDEPLILLTAPTGSAAFNIGGTTIHAAFMLSSTSGERMSWQKRSTLYTKLEKLVACINDEVSMVGSPTFLDMNKTMCKVGPCAEKAWGGISMLVVGDLYQLPPVGQPPVYRHSRTPQCLDDLAPLPWHDFRLHELTEVMRQKDIIFCNVLNAIRLKCPEENSFEDNMLKSRELTCGDHDEAYPKHALHVYANNENCTIWNEKMLHSLNTQLYVCKAADYKKDQQTNLANIPFPEEPRKTRNLLKVLKIKVGARVILTNNIDVSDGLTNGAMGTVANIIATTSSHIETILVRFDNTDVGSDAIAKSKYKHICADAVPIKRLQATFYVHEKVSFIGCRTQFPLFLSWAVTTHKSQGLTPPEIVVDMTPSKSTFNNGQAYVAFSRVRALEKLHIVNYTRQQIRVSADVANEMNRLRMNPLPDLPAHIVDDIDRSQYLCIVHLNIANITNKRLDISADEEFNKADIISFNETLLDPTDLIDNNMLGLDDDFDIFRCDRNRNGGGVMVLVRKHLQPVHCSVETDLEMVIVHITKPQPLDIVCLYRPQWNTVSSVMPKISHIILEKCASRTCVIGDINEDLSLSLDKPLYSMFKTLGFKQQITMPTRDCGTLIDHIYTRGFPGTNKSHVYDCYYSDHDFVWCCIENK